MSDRFAIPESPSVAALVKDLCTHYRAIREEAMDRLQNREYMVWPEEINLGGWGIHGLQWQGEARESEARVTTAVVHRHLPIIANAAFSVLMPGARIAPHTGYSGDVVRLHLCLLAPTEPGCELVVGGERRSWRDGEVFCFDDTEEHSAHNPTTQIRIVLILDIRRSAFDGLQTG